MSARRADRPWPGLPAGEIHAAGWLNERRAVLALLLVECMMAWVGSVYYILAEAPITPAARYVYYALAVITPGLLATYRRGWQSARYLGMIVNTLGIGFVLPLPSEHFEYLPQAIVLPSAVAMVLAGPAWVAGTAIASFSILVARAGGFNDYLSPVHVLGFTITVSCLLVSRLVVDAARREAEARAEQAEQARGELEQQATALQRQADELREQQTSLDLQASILSAVAQPVVGTDPRGRVTYWNRAAEEQLGWRADEILGRRMADLDPPPVDLPSDDAGWARLTAEEARLLEYTGRRRDGVEFPVLVSAWPIRADDGTPVGRVAVVTDLTERQEAERQRELFERGEKLRALGQMAGGIAHDLNQALAVVTGYVELALDDLDGRPGASSGPETRALLETAAQAAVQGADSVKRLLTFARQQDQGSPEIVDVAQMIGETVRFTAPQWRGRAQADGRPIDLVVEAEPDLRVRGWTTSLREALINLVLNAVDALPDGGTIRLAARQQGDAIVIEVADTGTGMSPEVRDRIFEPFFTTKGEHGTGLGLAMVFGTVQRHGGEIGVESVEGEGTTFSLKLPAATGLADDIEHDRPALEALPVRILVVDDEPRLALMLSMLLRRDGHDVETEASAEAAIEKLEGGGYDVVISDLSMGTGMNGWDLAQEVDRRWPDTRFVLASGWGAGIGEHEAQAQAVDAVLAKPYRLEELRRVVGRLTA